MYVYVFWDFEIGLKSIYYKEYCFINVKPFWLRELEIFYLNL